MSEINNLIEQFKKREVRAKEIFTLEIIDYKKAFEFVSSYHYLGSVRFLSVYSFGLFINKNLVGVASFGIPQGNVTLKGWFGLDNSNKDILELTRLCLIPDLNGSNATSYLLSNSIKKLKRKNIRAVITYADSIRHVGSIYQICNFKYYGITDKKCDFFRYDNEESFKKGARGKTKTQEGVWLNRTQKHRYAYIIDNSLKCLYPEQRKPLITDTLEYICCSGTNKVLDKRFNQLYTCPICTGKLLKIVE